MQPFSNCHFTAIKFCSIFHRRDIVMFDVFIVSDYGFLEKVKHRNGKMKQSKIKPSLDAENLSVLKESAGNNSDSNTDATELLRQEQRRRIRNIRDACANKTCSRTKCIQEKAVFCIIIIITTPPSIILVTVKYRKQAVHFGHKCLQFF